MPSWRKKMKGAIIRTLRSGRATSLKAQPSMESLIPMENVVLENGQKQRSATLPVHSDLNGSYYLRHEIMNTTPYILNVQLTAVPDSKNQFGIINLHRTFDDSSKGSYLRMRLNAYQELVPEGSVLHVSTDTTAKSSMKTEKKDKLYPIESRFVRVEGKLIPVSKEVLALFSPNFFRKLFYNEHGRVFKEYNQTVVEIKDQNYEDMKCLLESAMQFRSQLRFDSDSGTCFIRRLHLCTMFDLQALLERSKSYLVNSALSASNDAKAQIIDIAELYGDNYFLKRILSTFKYRTDLAKCISIRSRPLSPAFAALLIKATPSLTSPFPLSKSLTIVPTSATVPAAGGTTSYHTLSNRSAVRMVYKLTTSNNDHYRVNRIYGFVDSGCTALLEIDRLRGPRGMDNFTIHFARAPEPAVDAIKAFNEATPAGKIALPVNAVKPPRIH